MEKGWVLCAVIALAVPLFGDCTSPTVQWLAERVARYSYGIYLWHFPLIWVFYRKVALVLPFSASAAAFLLCLAACSVLSFHWVEAPLIKVGVRLSEHLSVPNAEVQTGLTGPRLSSRM
jgi:peptidoglycan/LPS O-acetylase OafA/YrhL